MDRPLYEKIKLFFVAGTLPDVFPSNKSNFLALAKKFVLNGKGNLLRNGKIVICKDELEDIWNSVHGHSGINISWKKVNGNPKPNQYVKCLTEIAFGFLVEKSGFDKK